MFKLIKYKEQKGATMVEMAIILPVLILIIFAIIEFSLLMYNKAMITNAAREGARYGVVWAPSYQSVTLNLEGFDADTNPYRISDQEVEQHVKSWLKNYLISFQFSEEDINVESDDPNEVCYGEEAGRTLSVTVNYDYSFL
jgi:Flp pilus assembly protein TadG